MAGAAVEAVDGCAVGVVAAVSAHVFGEGVSFVLLVGLVVFGGMGRWEGGFYRGERRCVIGSLGCE